MPEEFSAPVEESYRALIQKIDDAHMLLDLGRVRAAFELAARAHADQKRKDGSPYVTHAVAAAEIIVEMGMDEDSIVAALLHDVIEDTDYTADDLRALGISEAAMEAILLLTHDEAVPYLDYVRNLKDNPLARKVKIADLHHNAQLSRLDEVRPRDLERLEKYKAACEILGDDSPLLP